MPHIQKTLEEIAVRAIQLGRELGAALADGPRLIDPRNLGSAIRRLDDGDPFDGRDLHVLEAVAQALDMRIASETSGTSGTRVEIGEIECDEFGETRFGFVHVPNLSAEGEDLVQLRRRLDEFMFVRAVVLDRIAAQRAINNLSRR